MKEMLLRGEIKHMIIKNALVYMEDASFKTGDIRIEDNIIAEVCTSDGTSISNNDSIIFDATGLYAIPGLTDIHFHGCAGFDFCDGSHEALKKIAAYQAENGITTICPATMTLDEESLLAIVRATATYSEEEGAILCGINMEGPFISVNKKGAQNQSYIRKPDVEMFQKLQKQAGGLIKLVSLAPEIEGARDFIGKLKDDVVISLAHTEADYDITMEALAMGARHVTHLYNAMPPFSHRNPGVIGAVSDTSACSVELICDGYHIHPSVVRATFKMFGDDRIVLISDSMMAAGMPDGIYSLGGQQVKVSGKTATLLSDGTIAGSVSNLMDNVRNLVLNMGIPLETAIKCAAVNPAKVIGIYDRYGSIRGGKVANIVLLDDRLNIVSVILKGRPLL